MPSRVREASRRCCRCCRVQNGSTQADLEKFISERNPKLELNARSLRLAMKKAVQNGVLSTKDGRYRLKSASDSASEASSSSTAHDEEDKENSPKRSGAGRGRRVAAAKRKAARSQPDSVDADMGDKSSACSRDTDASEVLPSMIKDAVCALMNKVRRAVCWRARVARVLACACSRVRVCVSASARVCARLRLCACTVSSCLSCCSTLVVVLRSPVCCVCCRSARRRWTR